MLRGKSYAEYYDIHNELVDKDVAELLPPFLNALNWADGENILDHGCGTGRVGFRYLVPYAEKHGSMIYGLDISKGMIDYAKEKYPHPKIEYVNSSLLAADYPLKDLRFHKIFSLFVLMSDPDYRETLAEMYDILVPGGQIVLMIVAKTNLFECIDHVKKQADWAHFGAHLVKPDWFEGHDADYKPHFKEIVEKIGFEVKSSDMVPCKHIFANESDCAEFFISQNPVAHEAKLEHDDHRHQVHQTFDGFLSSSHGKERGAEYEIEYELINFLLQKPI